MEQAGMRITLFCVVALMSLCGVSAKAAGSTPMSEVLTVKPVPAGGFAWPYFLYLPPTAEARAATGDTVHLLVSTNNTGQALDLFLHHECSALRLLSRVAREGYALSCACLVPVFPRPAVHDSIYTHALDRDCLVTDIEGLERLDLQLLAMIDDARERLAQRGWHVGEKVLLEGFSASGMFANRFALLHPERVLAAAIGSPGGWPIAPVAHWKEWTLRYPIGVANLSDLVGREFQLEIYRHVPHFFFIGEQDENDSVVFRDGYEELDAELIFELFGDSPVGRWAAAEQLYKMAGASAEFRTYSDVGHEVTSEINRDIKEFFEHVLAVYR
jgi:predicted esterase